MEEPLAVGQAEVAAVAAELELLAVRRVVEVETSEVEAVVVDSAAWLWLPIGK